MLKWISILILLGFVVSGCAPQVGVKRLDAVQRPQQQGELPVYPSRNAVGRAFKQIALLSMEDKRSLRRDEAQDLSLLAEAARGLGADAVVILEKRTVTRRTKDPSGGGDIVYHYPCFEAAAIVFEE
jgi:hypothetical protein